MPPQRTRSERPKAGERMRVRLSVKARAVDFQGHGVNGGKLMTRRPYASAAGLWASLAAHTP